MLAGLVLDDGWTVGPKVGMAPLATGGNFSTAYTVERPGQTAFLKALDFSAAFQSPDPPRQLEKLAAAFNFERDLVFRCEARSMRNVVRALSAGTVAVPNAGPASGVSYIIFELADGDIRRQMALSESLDAAWSLRSLHHAALGIRQLHAAGIAHQDIKPSNVLTFSDGQLAKIADLGRACTSDGSSPYEDHVVAGDPGYAPPETFYGYVSPDWSARRKACDLFHLGSLVLFHFTRSNATGALFSELDTAYWPSANGGGWVGSYDDVLIYLRDALGRVAEAFPPLGDDSLRDTVIARFRELCEPDPGIRGHPKSRADKFGDPYSLERYVSSFDAMAARAERRLTRVLHDRPA